MTTIPAEYCGNIIYILQNRDFVKKRVHFVIFIAKLMNWLKIENEVGIMIAK